MPVRSDIYLRRIWCDSSGVWKQLWSSGAPTVCPDNGAHAVNSDSVQDLQHTTALRLTSADTPHSAGQDCFVCDTDGGGIVLNLHAAVLHDTNVSTIVTKAHATNTVTINAAGSDTIDGGGGPIVLSNLNDYVVLKSDGVSAWTTSVASQEEPSNISQCKSHQHELADVIDAGTSAARNTGTTSGNVPKIGTGNLGNLHVVVTNAVGNLESAAKATAFNKAFGSGSGDVAEGNHTHVAGHVTDFQSTVSTNTDVAASVTHAADSSLHRVISDGTTTTTSLWSSDKISADLAGKSANGHNHVASDVTDFNTAADARATVVLDAAKGAANGVATLDVTSKIPTSQLPALAITSVSVVTDISARNILTPGEGDVAKVTADATTWIYDGAEWVEVTANGDVLSVNGFTGAVSLTTTNVSEGTNQYHTTARVGAHADVAASVTHAADASLHRVISDGTSTTTSLWSSDKISTDLAGKSDTGHTHVKADVTDLGGASDTVSGLIELATQAEVNAGTDAIRAITPATLSAYTGIQNSYDAVVATSGGDYTSVSAAMNAGKKVVFVRNGIYTEGADVNVPANGAIVGESMSGVVLNMNGPYSVKCDANAGVHESAGTIDISHNSNIITGTGTTFTNLSPGEFVMLGENSYAIDTVDSSTQITLADTYFGNTLTGSKWVGSAMSVGIQLRGFIVVGSTQTGIMLRGLRNSHITNIAVKGCSSNVSMELCTNTGVSYLVTEQSVGAGLDISNCRSCQLQTVTAYSSGTHGIQIHHNSSSCIIESSNLSNNTVDGMMVQDTCHHIHVGDTVASYNGHGGFKSASGTGSLSLKGVTVCSNGGAGVDFDGTDNVLSGSIICTNSGVGIQGGVHNVVTGCQVRGNLGVGLEFGNDPDCTVTGCVVSGNGGDGIHFNNANQCVSCCRVFDNAGRGIGIDASTTNAMITGCNLLGNTGVNLEDLGTGSILASNHA